MISKFGIIRLLDRCIHTVIRAGCLQESMAAMLFGLVTVKMDIPWIDAFPGPAKQTCRLTSIVYMQSLTT